ncbi:MAG TPA: hypothetical protein VGE09_08350 [Pseudoxanthomonas sp.]
MTCLAKTLAEAERTAALLRFTFAGTDWTITIHQPLFSGDSYRVVVA